MAGPYGFGKGSLFGEAPSGAGLPADGEVLYWDTTTNKALGSPDLVFNDATKRLSMKGESLATVTKTADYTATPADHSILCDATAGEVTIDLPPAASSVGQVLHVKKIDASENDVVVSGYPDTVEDATTQALVRQGENLMIKCDGTQWWVL